MFDTICTLPLPAEVFAQVLHPTAPLLTVGLSSGHVHTYRLPAVDEEVNGEYDSDNDDDDHSAHIPTSSNKHSNLVNGNSTSSIIMPIISKLRRSSSASENGLGSISTVWKTRRHKGSCRCLSYSQNGAEYCYSAGTDGLVKAFSSETGRVVSKIAIPLAITKAGGGTGMDIDPPCVLHALSPQNLILGTDSGKVLQYDLREAGSGIGDRPALTCTPHDAQHVSSLVPLPATQESTSGYPKSWISVGGSTLAVIDSRKGVVKTSEDQEMELLSAAIIQGLKKGGTSVGEKVLVGQADGFITLWEKGVWDDLDDRIAVDRVGSAIETIIEVPSQFGHAKLKMNEKIVAAGMEDGRIRFVRIGRNGVLPEWDVKHDEIEGVVSLGFDSDGRMISAGGQIIKIWTEAKGLPGGGRNSAAKHELDSDEDSDEEPETDSDDEPSRDKSKRKKRKRNKSKDPNGGKAINFSGL